VAAYLLGGLLSGMLEGADAAGAARWLFLLAAGMMAAVALIGALVPPRVVPARGSRPPASLRRDRGPPCHGRGARNPAPTATLADLSASDHAHPVGFRAGVGRRAPVPPGQHPRVF